MVVSPSNGSGWELHWINVFGYHYTSGGQLEFDVLNGATRSWYGAKTLQDQWHGAYWIRTAGYNHGFIGFRHKGSADTSWTVAASAPSDDALCCCACGSDTCYPCSDSIQCLSSRVAADASEEPAP